MQEVELKKSSPEELSKEQPETQVELESPKETEPTTAEQPEAKPAQEKQERPQEQPTRAPAQQKSAPAPKDELLISIEKILSEDLADAYLAMSPERRIAFKKRGEEIAHKVKEMADSGRMRVHKVLKWLRDWLRMIPGVNKFFLEQEAKIKADKLLQYYKKHTGN